MRRDVVFALVAGKAEHPIRLHRVVSGVLERVGLYLVDKPNPPSLLSQIQHDPIRQFPEIFERRSQLVAAIAAKRSDRVSGQTLGVKPHRDIGAANHVAPHECSMLLLVLIVVKSDYFIMPETSWQISDCHHFNANAAETFCRTIMFLVFLQ